MGLADQTTADAAAVTAVIGYTAVVMNRLPKRFRRYGVFVSCAVGALYALTIRPADEHWSQQTVKGIMIGLSAAGGYSGMRDFRA
jgi:hypothetical protein